MPLPGLSYIYWLIHFNFAHFEIEECFGLILVKLQNGWFHSPIFISGIYKVVISGMGFICAHFVYKGSLGQIWVKITEWSIRFENFHFGAHFTNYGVPFGYFEYKKDIWVLYIGFSFV